MSRARAAAAPGISLFPFLAVLLCTMGALLVLLVLFSRSAQEADASAAAAAAAEATRVEEERATELSLLRDELAWRLAQLQGVREKTASDLLEARLQLAGIEDGGRTLADELAELERTAAALEAAGETEPETDDEQTIRELEHQLAEAREALETAREQAADRPPAYAVVPYEGKAGTHRRPLYIECCIDGVFLQPEGIRLGPGDFAWMFVPAVVGLILGAMVSGKVAGRWTPQRTIVTGFGVMLAAATLNVLHAAVFPPSVVGSILPIPIYTFGMSMAMPSV